MDKLPVRLDHETLLLVPCSKKKQLGGTAVRGRSMLDTLDSARSADLANGRAAIRDRAVVDEHALMPAYRRYTGALYTRAEASLCKALKTGRRVLIISGGYGLLLPDEPIGCYERALKRSDWPKDLLENCIVDYAQREGMRSVVAVMAATSDYAKLVRQVKWKEAGIKATLLSPISSGGGASGKVPRAHGQAVVDLFDGGLDALQWCGPDSSTLSVTRW